MPQQQQNRVVWLLGVLTLILRILLWPIRRLAVILFPPKELDGLSPAVTAKAVQSFVTELCALSSTLVYDIFCSSGFAAVRAESNQELILVYLHSPLQSNDARRRLLLSDSMLQYFQENEACLKVFGCSIHTAQGAHLAQSLHAAAYPLLALLQPTTNNSLQLVFCAQGQTLLKMSTTSLQNHLNTAVQRQQVVVAEAEARRIQRQEEIQLRQEQDAEYQETLRQDQERQRLAREAQEREEQLQREALERAQRAVQEKQDKLDKAKALIREEPVSGGTRVRFVLPTGAKIDRKFESSQQVKALRAFLTVHFHENDAAAIENIGLSTNYPKKSYDQEQDDELTLEEAGISPQAVLMVQDLDA